MNILLHDHAAIERHWPRWEAYLLQRGPAPLSRHPLWLEVLAHALGHEPYLLEAVAEERTRGFLALADVRGPFFGRFLVSLPYLNYGGPIADSADEERQLVDRAVALAEDLEVRHLELRTEAPIEHQALAGRLTTKVHLRRNLPRTADELWKELDPKVRNQVRKAQKGGVTVAWGRAELLDEFYAVFSRNMRDLGTPAYGRALFAQVLRAFPERAEIAVARLGPEVVAAALLLHGWGVSEVPSASSLREHNATCANMLLYWHLLERAVERGQRVFDFGRSTADSSTHRFKKQWDAEPSPATWQYHVREGKLGEMRPENPRYRRLIAVWQRLPLSLTRLIGPAIVRGIP